MFLAYDCWTSNFIKKNLIWVPYCSFSMKCPQSLSLSACSPAGDDNGETVTTREDRLSIARLSWLLVPIVFSSSSMLPAPWSKYSKSFLNRIKSCCEYTAPSLGSTALRLFGGQCSPQYFCLHNYRRTTRTHGRQTKQGICHCCSISGSWDAAVNSVYRKNNRPVAIKLYAPWIPWWKKLREPLVVKLLHKLHTQS